MRIIAKYEYFWYIFTAKVLMIAKDFREILAKDKLIYKFLYIFIYF